MHSTQQRQQPPPHQLVGGADGSKVVPPEFAHGRVGQGAQEHDREPRRHAHRASRLGRAEDHRRRGTRDPRQGVRHKRQREGLQDAPRLHPRHPGRWHLVRDARRDLGGVQEGEARLREPRLRLGRRGGQPGPAHLLPRHVDRLDGLWRRTSDDAEPADSMPGDCLKQYFEYRFLCLPLAARHSFTSFGLSSLFQGEQRGHGAAKNGHLPHTQRRDGSVRGRAVAQYLLF